MFQDSYLSSLNIANKKYYYLDFEKLNPLFDNKLTQLPVTLKILLENSLRNANSQDEFNDIINSFKYWLNEAHSKQEVLFYPSRVLMQDFTGVPAIVDLASMREAVANGGGDSNNINPLTPVDLVIDHSVQVDSYGLEESYKKNTELEFKRNAERYQFLKWGQKSFANFRVVPPGGGICHQINLEYLAPVIAQKEIAGKNFLLPDTLVGTDSHTTMICGIGALGWGVGGIEAEAAMLGKAISMLIPDVVGFKLTGELNEGVTATDLVLTITEKLRQIGVVGKFVEFYGDALANLSLADRATISNMSPEYGATCGYFAIDEETMKYLRLTARDETQIELITEYAKQQKIWRNDDVETKYTTYLELDLAQIEACVSGPKRPQDRITLPNIKQSYLAHADQIDLEQEYPVNNQDFSLKNGDIVIAAITSCTNTSNPAVLIAAGLVAKKALALGLKPKPFVKTSLAPGSQIVTEYLKKSGLKDALDEFGFNIVGYGCTTCIGNSGPINSDIADSISNNNLNVASILSGNRNFEGRIHALVKSNYLASPPLVVAFAILGNITKDITKASFGLDQDGNDILLKDIWPSDAEVADIIANCLKPQMFKSKYDVIFQGDKEWQNIDITPSNIYNWDVASTYIKNPPFFANLNNDALTDINNANILALFGDSITTDHISPAGQIAKDSPAANYLIDNNVVTKEFNSYGARRGNHEVMMRGTFANIRIQNQMTPDKTGGYTIYMPENKLCNIYDAAMQYQENNIPLVIIAGKEYGTGSSRDWAAKGTLLLGVKAVIAESFERIHRSNLVGMGVLPLCFLEEQNAASLNLSGKEQLSLLNLDKISPLGAVDCRIQYQDGTVKDIKLRCRIDTEYEMENFLQGGVLQSVVKSNVS